MATGKAVRSPRLNFGMALDCKRKEAAQRVSWLTSGCSRKARPRVILWGPNCLVGGHKQLQEGLQ